MDKAEALLRHDELVNQACPRGQETKRGYHKHRIVPGYQGGEYSDGNVVLLTRTEHIEIHLLRWVMFDNHRDLLACKLLGENLSDVEWLTCARRGGAAAGTILRDTGRGVCGRSKEKMSSDAKKANAAMPMSARIVGGKISGARLKLHGLGIFAISKEQNSLNGKKGGAISGRRIKYEDRVKGSIRTTWFTDGLTNLRLRETAAIPDGFRPGRAPFKRRTEEMAA